MCSWTALTAVCKTGIRWLWVRPRAHLTLTAEGERPGRHAPTNQVTSAPQLSMTGRGQGCFRPRSTGMSLAGVWRRRRRCARVSAQVRSCGWAGLTPLPAPPGGLPRPAWPSLLCGSEAGGARLCGRPPLCLLCVCCLFGMELVSQLWRAGRQTGLPFLFCFVFLRRAIFSPLETILGLGGYNSGFHVEGHTRPPWLRGVSKPGRGRRRTRPVCPRGRTTLRRARREGRMGLQWCAARLKTALRNVRMSE